jgi:hypothetical protein
MIFSPSLVCVSYAAWDPSYLASGLTYRKHRLLIHCCRDVFTAQLRSNERCPDPQGTPLATPFLLLRDGFLCCICTGHYLVTAVSLPPQFLLWANTPLCIYIYIYIYTSSLCCSKLSNNPLPPLAGQPKYVFIMVNVAWRYFALSIDRIYTWVPVISSSQKLNKIIAATTIVSNMWD